MTVSVFGISFHTAPVALREQASVSASEVPATLQRLRAEFPKAELVLVSTCNRTEIYTTGMDADADKYRLIGMLLKGKASLHPAEIEKHFYVKNGLEAAEHLLAVTASLDAMVVGETEILGQVKQALGLAEGAQTVGKGLHPLFQNAFRVAKRVHTE
ncbi:MAG: glutamyl-tRNA reductase, partial [bacterium]